MAGQAESGSIKPSQAKAAQAKAAQAKAAQAKTAQAKAGPLIATRTTAGQSIAGQAKPGSIKPMRANTTLANTTLAKPTQAGTTPAKTARAKAGAGALRATPAKAGQPAAGRTKPGSIKALRAKAAQTTARQPKAPPIKVPPVETARIQAARIQAAQVQAASIQALQTTATQTAAPQTAASQTKAPEAAPTMPAGAETAPPKITLPEGAPVEPVTIRPETAITAPAEATAIRPETSASWAAETTTKPPQTTTTAPETTTDAPPQAKPEAATADTKSAHGERTLTRRPIERTAGIVADSPTTAATRPPIGTPEPVRSAGPRTEEGLEILAPPSGTAAADETAATRAALTPAARKVLHRRRRGTLLAFVGIAVAVLGVGQFIRNDHSATVTRVVPAASALPQVRLPGEAAAPSAGGRATTTGATEGSNTAKPTNPGPKRSAGAFAFVRGYGPVLGTAGPLQRFKVSVEKTVDQGDGSDFADEIDSTLGDRRSWIASGKVRFQRVPASVTSEFTIYLASAGTSKRLCANGGLATDGYTSCRLPGQVIINNDRWQDSVPDYDASLSTYRAYAVNHEVGHQLGHGHEACPGRGRTAPVMMQQTFGLKGCIANAWPYIGGRRYVGKPTD